VQIYSVSAEGMAVARREIEGLTAEIEIGKLYRGRVVTIKEFGCFVELFPGQDGLVHISELANFRVKQTEDIVKLGDEIWVKCLGVDEKGRVRLSRRAAMEERDRQENPNKPLAVDGGAPDQSAGNAAPSDADRAPEGERPPERDRGERTGDHGERPRGGGGGGRHHRR